MLVYRFCFKTLFHTISYCDLGGTSMIMMIQWCTSTPMIPLIATVSISTTLFTFNSVPITVHILWCIIMIC